MWVLGITGDGLLCKRLVSTIRVDGGKSLKLVLMSFSWAEIRAELGHLSVDVEHQAVSHDHGFSIWNAEF